MEIKSVRKNKGIQHNGNVSAEENRIDEGGAIIKERKRESSWSYRKIQDFLSKELSKYEADSSDMPEFQCR